MFELVVGDGGHSIGDDLGQSLRDFSILLCNIV